MMQCIIDALRRVVAFKRNTEHGSDMRRIPKNVRWSYTPKVDADAQALRRPATIVDLPQNARSANVAAEKRGKSKPCAAFRPLA
jgi:hypothetical protein